MSESPFRKRNGYGIEAQEYPLSGCEYEIDHFRTCRDSESIYGI